MTPCPLVLWEAGVELVTRGCFGMFFFSWFCTSEFVY